MYEDRDISDYIADIATAVNDALEFIRGMSYEAFENDRKTVNAVIRSLEIVGEAYKENSEILSPEISRYPME